MALVPLPISIVIADDHPPFREGLARLLADEADFRMAGTAGTADECLRLIREQTPDVLLLDMAMPGRSGIDVLRDLSGVPSAPRVIVLTASIDETRMIEALELGAQGIVLKETATHLLLKAIRTVMTGQYWVGRESVTSLVDGLKRARSRRLEQSTARFALTDRQLEIIRAIVAGATNREIAKALGITEDTVKQHLTTVFDKCGVSSRVELALFAVDHHLVER